MRKTASDGINLLPLSRQAAVTARHNRSERHAGGRAPLLFALLFAAMAVLTPRPALALLPADAAGCAAFFLANADFEERVFDPEDVDYTWTRQAALFRQVARRLDMTKAEIDAIIARDRPLLRRMIEGFILDLDAASRRLFITRSETCDRIVKTAPEFDDAR